MNIPPSDHAIWKIARLAIVSATMLLFFGMIYKSPIESKDLITIFGTLAALAGFDWTKATVTKQE